MKSFYYLLCEQSLHPSPADVCQFAEALQKDLNESEPSGEGDPCAASEGQAGEGAGQGEGGGGGGGEGGGGEDGTGLKGKEEEKAKDDTAPEKRGVGADQ